VQAVELAKRAVQLGPKDSKTWIALGIAHYRAGDWLAAKAALEKAIDVAEGGDSYDWFFLSMTHWQLGNKKEARKWYDKGVEWMAKNKRQEEELRRFQAEAAELMGLLDPSKQSDPPKKEERQAPLKE